MTSRILSFAALAFLAINPAIALLSIEKICEQTPEMTAWGQILKNHPEILDLYKGYTNLTLYIPSNDAVKKCYPSSYRRQDASAKAAADAGYAASTDYNNLSNLSTGDKKQDTLGTGSDGKKQVNVAGEAPSTSKKRGWDAYAPAPQPPGLQVYTGLGETTQILFGDILCKQGIAHVIDSCFTFPAKTLETLETLSLNKFLDALKYTGLIDEVERADKITMFVPEDSGIMGKLDANALKEHIVFGDSIYGDRLYDGNKFMSASGEELCITVKGKTIYVNGVEVVQKNVIIRNGSVHVLAKSLCECEDCEPEEVHSKTMTYSTTMKYPTTMTYSTTMTYPTTSVYRSYRA